MHRLTTFDEVMLALHILFAIVAFGVLFAYPFFLTVGARLDPAAMPWFHRMQVAISRRLIAPGLVGVVIFGVILASELDSWGAFYVQWGIGAAIVIGALEGMYMIPQATRLVGLAEDEAASPARARGGPVIGAAYRAGLRQLTLGASVISLLVVVTVFLMAAHVGR